MSIGTAELASERGLVREPSTETVSSVVASSVSAGGCSCACACWATTAPLADMAMAARAMRTPVASRPAANQCGPLERVLILILSRVMVLFRTGCRVGRRSGKAERVQAADAALNGK
jgi:hypothetical protein